MSSFREYEAAKVLADASSEGLANALEQARDLDNPKAARMLERLTNTANSTDNKQKTVEVMILSCADCNKLVVSVEGTRISAHKCSGRFRIVKEERIRRQTIPL